MKQIILFSLISLILNSVQASESWCGYRDYFYFDEHTPPTVFIVGANSSAEVYLNIIGPRSFQIKDADCSSGYAQITVAGDFSSWCVLDIKDGPFMRHPIVHASCNGLAFLGMAYDGSYSYAYALKFRYI